MKNKNRVLKTCLTALAFSVAGLANAQSAPEEPVKIFTPQLMSHAAISGAALSIAADSVIDGNLAAQAAVTIGAGLKSQTQHIYAGAAVTTGALSTVKNIFSGAATGIGASAHAQNVHAGAAITVGAGGDVQAVYAGAAITLGAGASKSTTPLADGADTLSAAEEDIHNAISMAAAIAQIGVAQAALTTLNDTNSLYTTMGGFETLAPGVHQGSAVSIAANSIVEFKAVNDSGKAMDHVWVINLTEALTVGAGTVFETVVPEGDTATIIWNVGAAVTLGAGSTFLGTAFVEGAVSGATASVSCGNLYATGAISIGSIGGDDCKVAADQLADFSIDEGDYSLRDDTVYALGDTGPAGGIVFHVSDDGLNGLEAAPADQVPAEWGCSGTLISGANGTAVGTGKQNTAIIAGCNETTAASVASAYGPGWYLPSKDELNLLYLQKVAGVVDGFDNKFYWSSSQVSPNNAWLQYFGNGFQLDFYKTLTLSVRAVRAF